MLFSGHSYTDYHVTLQTEGPSVVGNSIAATATSVTNTHDAAPLSHVAILPRPSAIPLHDQEGEGIVGNRC